MKKETEIVVYFPEEDDNPECVWCYYHKPQFGDRKYAELLGMWLIDEEDKKSKYKECSKKTKFFMDYSEFLDRIVPDKKKIKSYESIDDFERDMFIRKL